MCSLLNQTKKIENEKNLERDQLIELETHFLKIDTNHKFQSDRSAFDPPTAPLLCQGETPWHNYEYSKSSNPLSSVHFLMRALIGTLIYKARGEQARTFTQQLRNKKSKKGK